MRRRWQRFPAALAGAAGFGRSLLIYYGQPWRVAAMRRHYAPLIAPGDLVFDIGAHVGNQTRCFAGLGAKVVAVEPQPQLARWLRYLFRREPRVAVLETAIGARPGRASLYPSPRTPTVASMSSNWIAAVSSARSFAAVRWGAALEVPVTTLDALIEQYGPPQFCKIDVEGFEAEILRGLSRPIPLLSFEYVPAAVAIACEAAGLLAALGPYRFNLTIGERRRFLWPEWQEPAAILAWLRERRRDERSGDVYARLKPIGTSW